MCRYAAFTAVPMITMIVLATILTSSAMFSGESEELKQQRLTFINLVERAGYIVDEYDAITEDGYILCMHRIRRGPKSPVASGKSPILLIHGLLGSSDNWVAQSWSEYNLAYLLVDRGYDVWLPNVRGTFCSRRHLHISVEDPKFWHFSWHEIGVYDIAVSIDRVLSVTGMPKVSLVGYSLGGTAVYVLLSMRPAYNEKVNVAFIFASVAIVTHDLPGSIIKAFLHYGDILERFDRYIDIAEIFPRGRLDTSLFQHCRQPLVQAAFQAMMFQFFGVITDNTLCLPDIVKYFQGTSLKILLHFRQIILSGKFTQYDFGRMKNYGRYGSSIPPEYPLDKITAPMVLYYAPGDFYTTKQDVEVLLKIIPNAVSREVPHPNFGHLDFIIHRTARTLIYDQLIRILDGYTHDKLNERSKI